jgi:hypothetical protein
MSTPYEPDILPGDDIITTAPNVQQAKFHVQATAGAQLLVTNSQGGANSISRTQVRAIYRNGLLIWQK